MKRSKQICVLLLRKLQQPNDLIQKIEKRLNYTHTTAMQTNNNFCNSKKQPNISGVCEVSFVPSPRLPFFLLLWFGVFSRTNDSVSKYNSMTFQGLYPRQKLKGAWHGESDCGRKMFGKNLLVLRLHSLCAAERVRELQVTTRKEDFCQSL